MIRLEEELDLHEKFLKKYRIDSSENSYLVRLTLLAKDSGGETVSAGVVRDLWKNHLNRSEKIASFYLHIPYCAKRCHFCCYSSKETEKVSEIDSYVATLSDYLKFFEPAFEGRRLVGFYIGGGTPSLLNESQLKKLFSSIFSSFEFDPNGKRTIELNPSTSPRSKLELIKGFGLNRLSFGVQSLDKDVLSLNGRGYQTTKAVATAVRNAKDIGFDEVNIDLLAGLYGDDPKRFARSFKSVAEMGPDTIFIYSVQPTEHYLKVCGMDERKFFDHKKRLTGPAMTEIAGIAKEFGYAVPDAMDSGDGRKKDTLIFTKKGSKRAGYIDIPGSLFGLGLYSFSKIDKKIHYRMLEPLVPNPSDYRFSSSSYNERKEMAGSIYASLSFRGYISLSRFKHEFGKDLTVEFKEAISKLRSLKAVRTVGDKIYLGTDKDGWLRFILFFFDKEEIEKLIHGDGPPKMGVRSG